MTEQSRVARHRICGSESGIRRPASGIRHPTYPACDGRPLGALGISGSWCLLGRGSRHRQRARSGSVLILAGALVISAGVVFPRALPGAALKALTALAVAQGLSADMIHSAGLQIGVILLLMAVSGIASWLARVCSPLPVIRSLQFRGRRLARGVGGEARLEAAIGLREFAAPRMGLGVGGGDARSGSHRRCHPALFPDRPPVRRRFAGWDRCVTQVDLGVVELHLPSFGLPPWSVAGSAFVLLVVPQIPLTYGNAVVGVSHLARSTLVTPPGVCHRDGLRCRAGSGTWLPQHWGHADVPWLEWVHGSRPSWSPDCCDEPGARRCVSHTRSRVLEPGVGPLRPAAGVDACRVSCVRRCSPRNVDSRPAPRATGACARCGSGGNRHTEPGDHNSDSTPRRTRTEGGKAPTESAGRGLGRDSTT